MIKRPKYICKSGVWPDKYYKGEDTCKTNKEEQQQNKNLVWFLHHAYSAWNINWCDPWAVRINTTVNDLKVKINQQYHQKSKILWVSDRDLGNIHIISNIPINSM